MHKPHEYPLHVRFWHLLRGLLFYNTVYWKRASDDLRPPRLSREERNNLQPALDPDILRPRERPRAHPQLSEQPPQVAAPPFPVPTTNGGEVSEPVVQLERRVVLPLNDPVQISEPPPEAGDDAIIVKRRRYRRRKKNVRASRSPGILAANQKQGFFARWFGS